MQRNFFLPIHLWSQIKSSFLCKLTRYVFMQINTIRNCVSNNNPEPSAQIFWIEIRIRVSRSNLIEYFFRLLPFHKNFVEFEIKIFELSETR